MKIVFLCAAVFLASIPAGAAAASERLELRSLIKAIKQGNDLDVVYPGAISPKEIALLSRLAKCDPKNPMRQNAGHYTVVWVCGLKGASGMTVMFQDGKVTSVSTMEVERRPDVGTR